MKSDSEKFYEDFQRFLVETGREEPREAEMEDLLQEYVEVFNERARTLQPMVDEVSADAFLDRAQAARSRWERLKWIQKGWSLSCSKNFSKRAKDIFISCDSYRRFCTWQSSDIDETTFCLH
ncbi:hypothetical protein [Selenomonas sp.]|uniref:hypothetical protein n=1 Tax=Selenomonas sp. TaxID=2053611 RepID=UPI003FA32882